jgi:hypothetical protein
MILATLNIIGCVILFPLVISMVLFAYWMIGAVIFEMICDYKYIDGSAALIRRVFDAYEQRKHAVRE